MRAYSKMDGQGLRDPVEHGRLQEVQEEQGAVGLILRRVVECMGLMTGMTLRYHISLGVSCQTRRVKRRAVYYGICTYLWRTTR